MDESFVTYDDVLFCVMRLSSTFCDLMYELARHSTHGFFMFDASLEHTHTNYDLFTYAYGLTMLSMFIDYANVYLTHDLPMHQITYSIVLEYADT